MKVYRFPINAIATAAICATQIRILNAAHIKFVPYNVTIPNDPTHHESNFPSEESGTNNEHDTNLFHRKMNVFSNYENVRNPYQSIDIIDKYTPLPNWDEGETVPPHESPYYHGAPDPYTPSYQYGYFQVSYHPSLCIEIPGTTLHNRKKLKIRRCRPGKTNQLWRIDDNCQNFSSSSAQSSSSSFFFTTLQSQLSGYESCGKIHSLANDAKCIQVRKDAGYRARLYIYECKDNKENQIWVYDYDCLMPSGDLGMTATTWRREGARGGDPVLLEECGGNSLDFRDFED